MSSFCDVTDDEAHGFAAHQHMPFPAANPVAAVPADVPGAFALNQHLDWLALHLAALAQLRAHYAIFQEFDQ